MEQAIKQAFADTFVMYFKAHTAHWNIEGMLFKQFHDYFGEVYQEIYGSIDTFAEEIRASGYLAPHNMDNLYGFKTVSENATPTTDAKELLVGLLETNMQVLASLNNLFEAAVANKAEGLADFVAGRIDAHKKHEWMLKSFLRG